MDGRSMGFLLNIGREVTGLWGLNFFFSFRDVLRRKIGGWGYYLVLFILVLVRN